MIALDDDSASRQLSATLRKAGHDLSTPTDLGIPGAPDPGRISGLVLVGANQP